MHRLAILPALLLALAPPTAAQVPVSVGQAYEDSLSTGETDVYTLELGAHDFVFGHADQRTVDVVVAVYDPEGTLVRRFDGPARGPEPFQFETRLEGRHRIEVKPAEGAAGIYALVVERAEPVAADPAARVDQLMARYAGSDVPGGVVGVVRDGELLFGRAYGMANLTHGVPFSLDTRTNLGSTSKQFTAFALALLAERGELSLDDDVRTHIPELPDLGAPVTLRNLLTHTSGYREFLNTLALAGRRLDRGDHIDRGELIAIVQRQPELQNAPGAEWNYNNTAFGLATVVVERVTGQPFPQWMRENVFGPLGMENTFVRAHPAQIIPGSSQGYAPAEEAGWRLATDLGGAMGAGGIYTTVGDLATWIGNFESGRLGGPDIFEAMTTPFVLTTGDTTGYGMGLFVDEHRGLARIHHGGADAAHRAMLRYYPELDAGVVALSNNATFNSGAIADAVAEAFFAEHLEPRERPSARTAGDDPASADPATAPHSAEYDPERFDALAGRYALDTAPTFILTFMREGERLFTQATGQPRFPITPTSDSTFTLVGVPARVTFHLDEEGGADSLTLHQNGEHRARRVDEGWSPTPEELAAYAGRYFSPELETYYTVAVEDGTLVVRHRRLPDPVELEPGQERDRFGGGFPAAEVTFERAPDGSVSALLVSNGRTRGVRFERVEP
ncbi:MAG TPA: serine hydrolase [Longimicrobiales bacterium]|nr:serine hydrolase [Longimicrobiales bacterium]